MNTMTLGTSTVLVAVGAIMRYAVSARSNGFDVPMIGGILMIVGIVGALISIAVFASSNRQHPAVEGGPSTVIMEEHNDR